MVYYTLVRRRTPPLQIIIMVIIWAPILLGGGLGFRIWDLMVLALIYGVVSLQDSLSLSQRTSS